MISRFSTPDRAHRLGLLLMLIGCLAGISLPTWHVFSLSDEHGDRLDDDDDDVCRLSRRLLAEDVLSAGVPTAPLPPPPLSSLVELYSNRSASNRRIVPVTSTLWNMPRLLADELLELFCSVSSLITGSRPSSCARAGGLSVLRPSSLLTFVSCLPASGVLAPALSSSPTALLTLARLADRLVKELVMLATLSLRIIEDADVRTMCSLRARLVMPGNGSMSRLQTSESSASSRARSPLEGASTGIRVFVVSSDWDRLIGKAVGPVAASFRTLVFLSMTWHRGDFGPTVVARCIDILLAMVPVGF